MTTLEKIDIRPIVTNHIGTLYDFRTDERSYPDLLLFFDLPLAPAGLVLWKGRDYVEMKVRTLLTRRKRRRKSRVGWRR